MEENFINKAFTSKPHEAQLETFQELMSSDVTPAFQTWVQLRKIVTNFEEHLDSEHEVMFIFVSLNVGLAQVKNISYWSPELLIFDCYIDNVVDTILLQHYSQLNFLLSSRKKENPNSPARRIGFTTNIQNDNENYRN